MAQRFFTRNVRGRLGHGARRLAVGALHPAGGVVQRLSLIQISVAQYYAALPAPLNIDRLAATARQLAKPDDTGAWLATRGAWDKNVPACNQCHGPGGIGVGANFPSLAGQPAAYIAGQLRAWRQGQRPPGPLGLMPAVATRLTAAEIDAVSAYYAGLPKAADLLAAQANTAAGAKP